MPDIDTVRPGGCAAGPAGSASEISPPEFLRALAAGRADVIDVRTGPEYRAAHVKGARHAPLHALDPAAVRAGRPAGAEGPIYVLCQRGGRAATAAEGLRRAGVPCLVVTGGTDGCVASGAPVEGTGRLDVWPVERQVRFVAGLLVLAGVALGALVHPWAYGLAAFVGAGLTFAGATGTCGMAVVLGRCPWNR